MRKKVIQVLLLAPLAIVLFFAGWFIQYSGVSESQSKHVKTRNAVNLQIGVLTPELVTAK